MALYLSDDDDGGGDNNDESNGNYFWKLTVYDRHFPVALI